MVFLHWTIESPKKSQYQAYDLKYNTHSFHFLVSFAGHKRKDFETPPEHTVK